MEGKDAHAGVELELDPDRLLRARTQEVDGCRAPDVVTGKVDVREAAAALPNVNYVDKREAVPEEAGA